MGVCEFINQVHRYTFDGSTYSYTTLDYAKWASYQTYRSPYTGVLPVALFVIQWGWESGWGGPNWSDYDNPAEQGASCGFGATCGEQPAGFPIFCTIRDGVMSYTNLLAKGYPHVQYAYGTDGFGDTGIQSAFRSLGRGYYPGFSTAVNFCGWSGTPNGNPDKRLWDQAQYDDGSGPGSELIGVYTYSGNQCVRDLNFVQYSKPSLPGFDDIVF